MGGDQEELLKARGARLTSVGMNLVRDLGSASCVARPWGGSMGNSGPHSHLVCTRQEALNVTVTILQFGEVK